MERYIVLDSTGNKIGIPFKEWKARLENLVLKI